MGFVNQLTISLGAPSCTKKKSKNVEITGNLAGDLSRSPGMMMGR
jgi:hypothetical protein